MIQAAAVILAGGKSTRMGKNKALVRVTEHRMLEQAVKLLSGNFTEILISANEDSYGYLKVKTVPDIFPDRGPLGGIHAGLRTSGYETNFFVACDMPFIDINLALYMVGKAQEYDAVVPRIGTYYQPLFAVYSKSCLPAIEQFLSKGVNKISSFFYEVNTRFLDLEEMQRFGNPDKLFFNVNTPSDLDRAKTLAGRDD